MYRTIVYKLDTKKNDAIEKTSQGFLKIPAYCTRSGIFEYEEDGKTIKEFRPPEEVFNEKSMKSLALVPVTKEHPTEMLDSKNYKKYEVGNTGESIVREKDFLKCNVIIKDPEIIEEIEEKKENGQDYELSCGYECEVVDSAGEYNGEKYDRVQTDISYNHLSLVDEGRAGKDVKLKLDKNKSKKNDKEKAKMIKIKMDAINTKKLKLDAIEISVPEEQSENVEKLISNVKEAAKQVSEMEKETEKIKAEKDAMEEEKKTVDEENNKMKKEREKEKSDKEKEELKDMAGEVGMSEEEIKDVEKEEYEDEDEKEYEDACGSKKRDSNRKLKIAILKKRYSKFDSNKKTKSYLDARIDALKETLKEEKANDKSVKTFNQKANETKKDSSTKKDARAEFIRKTQEMHKPKE
jgi:hypothetical protein